MAHALDHRPTRGVPPRRTRGEAHVQRVHRRLARRLGLLAVGLIAATLVTLAVVLPGTGGSSPQMSGMAGFHGPAVGAVAPDFSLVDATSGQTVKRSVLLGHKTLLFFSEGVSCQACMVQVADLQKSSALARDHIALVSISTDAPTQLGPAGRQYGITTPLVADVTTQMSMAYGMLGYGGMGMAGKDGHAFMLLGSDGKVLWQRAYTTMYVSPSQLLADMGGLA